MKLITGSSFIEFLIALGVSSILLLFVQQTSSDIFAGYSQIEVQTFFQQQAANYQALLTATGCCDCQEKLLAIWARVGKKQFSGYNYTIISKRNTCILTQTKGLNSARTKHVLPCSHFS